MFKDTLKKLSFLKAEGWAVIPAHVAGHWLWATPWGGVHVTSQIFPSRKVFMSQGQAFRESRSANHQLLVPAAAGVGRTGPIEGL